MSDPIKVSEVTAMLRQQLADIDNEEKHSATKPKLAPC